MREHVKIKADNVGNVTADLNRIMLNHGGEQKKSVKLGGTLNDPIWSAGLK